MPCTPTVPLAASTGKINRFTYALLRICSINDLQKHIRTIKRDCARIYYDAIRKVGTYNIQGNAEINSSPYAQLLFKLLHIIML